MPAHRIHVTFTARNREMKLAASIAASIIVGAMAQRVQVTLMTIVHHKADWARRGRNSNYMHARPVEYIDRYDPQGEHRGHRYLCNLSSALPARLGAATLSVPLLLHVRGKIPPRIVLMHKRPIHSRHRL